MDTSRLPPLLFICFLLAINTIWINSVMFGLDGFTLISFPLGALAALAAYFLWSHAVVHSTRNTPLTCLPATHVQALITQAKPLNLHVTRILHRPIRNAQMVWTGWHRGIPTWVILYDEIFNTNFSPEEATALIYHEMGHGLNRDAFWNIPIHALVGAWLLSVIRIIFEYVSLILLHQQSVHSILIAHLGAVVLFFGTACCIPRLLFKPREYKADWWSYQLAGSPQPMVQVLHHMRARESAQPSYPAWLEAAMDTHPTATQRIAYLQQFMPAPTTLSPPQTHHPEG